MSKELLFSFVGSSEFQAVTNQLLNGLDPELASKIPDVIELAQTIYALRNTDKLGSEMLKKTASQVNKLKIK